IRHFTQTPSRCCFSLIGYKDALFCSVLSHSWTCRVFQRKALIVLFQHWFGAAAEEASVSSTVSLYLREVRSAAPALLAFMVNLADDNSNTALHYSVSHCNYDIVGLLLDTGVVDVNIQNNAGYTAVMLASLTAPDGPAGTEVVRRLMELGSINVQSKQTGQTALHLAARHGRGVMVRLLLSFGADANIQDERGTTALMFASGRGHTHIARLLLERSQCDPTLSDKVELLRVVSPELQISLG
uniref:KN motif and ankyrin repeat domain-containing protein 4-like n=1 Tax=Salarias fasciatus TaxID=181472 RepID=A0A672IA36_SALFA